MGCGNHRCQQLFTAGRAVLSLDFPPLTKEKNKHLFWLISLPFLQFQIKLTGWLDSGRGDLLFSQIIFVSFLPMYSLPVISSMYVFDSWNYFYYTFQSVLLIARIFFHFPITRLKWLSDPRTEQCPQSYKYLPCISFILWEHSVYMSVLTGVGAIGMNNIWFLVLNSSASSGQFNTKQVNM